MAFKMKGSSYKMGGAKTKQTMAYMKSPLEQVVTQVEEDMEGNPVNTVGSWKETKNTIQDMSGRERRKAVKETKQELKERTSNTKQKTYWDPTTKQHKKVPGIFSSKARKEDFIIKQTMKKRDKGGLGEGMSLKQIQEYKDAGIDPTTMGRRTELDSE